MYKKKYIQTSNESTCCSFSVTCWAITIFSLSGLAFDRMMDKVLVVCVVTAVCFYKKAFFSPIEPSTISPI